MKNLIKHAVTSSHTSATAVEGGWAWGDRDRIDDNTGQQSVDSIAPDKPQTRSLVIGRYI